MIGRLAVRSAVAIAVLYVAVAMAAALAEIGPRDVGGIPAADKAPGAVFDAELYDLRVEEIVP